MADGPETPARGRRPGVDTALRTAAVWAVVRDVAARRRAELGRPLRVVDIGGGTGGLAVPLAVEGHDVTVVDPSPDALASLRRRATGDGVEARITARQGDAETLPVLLGEQAGRVDLVCCHGTLEVVDDPEAAVAGIADALAPGGVLSLVTAQRLAAVVARALAGQLDQARTVLDDPNGRWGPGDPVLRRFDASAVTDLLTRHALTVTDVHGVRILSDLVPSAAVDADDGRRALLALEDALTRHPAYGPLLRHLGAAVHVLATRDAS